LIGLSYIYGFDLSPDASQLALTRASYQPDEVWEVRLYDFDPDSGVVSETGLTFPLPDNLRFSESKLSYSRDGRLLAVNGGYEQNFAYIFDLGVPASNRVDLPDNGGTYAPVFFRWQGVLKLALGGGYTDGAISVVDVPSLSFEDEFPAFPHYIYSLDVDPAEEYLVAGGYDGLLKIFRLENEEMTEAVVLDSGFVARVAFTADGEYVVSAHGVSDGARLNIFRIIRETVGEEWLFAGPVGLFPNPVTDKLWINEAFGAEVTVFDVQGRVVMRRIYDGSPLDVAALPEGNYFLKAVYDGRVATGQFVKTGR
jgi:DNA-binding beta-propeller fold protein YncE